MIENLGKLEIKYLHNFKLIKIKKDDANDKCHNYMPRLAELLPRVQTACRLLFQECYKAGI
ncbi:hypothetical protein LSP03_42150 [Lysinibacillus sphaericus]|nr:hypothetical protein LSP03_42150 [Lysinibacillus sphaericus]